MCRCEGVWREGRAGVKVCAVCGLHAGVKVCGVHADVRVCGVRGCGIPARY